MLAFKLWSIDIIASIFIFLASQRHPEMIHITTTSGIIVVALALPLIIGYLINERRQW